MCNQKHHIISKNCNVYYVILKLRVTWGHLAGQQTCHLQVVGSSPDWAPLRSWPWASYLHLCAFVTKQYNLVLAEGVISLAGKVTAGLAESNGSLPPGL